MKTCCTMHFTLYFGLITILSLEYAVFMTTADGAIDLSRYYISVFHSNHAVILDLCFDVSANILHPLNSFLCMPVCNVRLFPLVLDGH